MTAEHAPAENPEAFRAGVLTAINNYDIHVANVEIPGERYGEDFMEFTTNSSVMGDVRTVVGHETDVSVDGTNLADIDGNHIGDRMVMINDDDPWETRQAILRATMFDPRFTLKALEDVKVLKNGNLSGTIDPTKIGYSNEKDFDDDFDNKTLVEITETFLECVGEPSWGVISEENYTKALELAKQFENLSAEEIKKIIKRELDKPWEFEIELDNRNLPISIIPKTDPLLSMSQAMGGKTTFEYTP